MIFFISPTKTDMNKKNFFQKKEKQNKTKRKYLNAVYIQDKGNQQKTLFLNKLLFMFISLRTR